MVEEFIKDQFLKQDWEGVGEGSGEFEEREIIATITGLY